MSSRCKTINQGLLSMNPANTLQTLLSQLNFVQDKKCTFLDLPFELHVGNFIICQTLFRNLSINSESFLVSSLESLQRTKTRKMAGDDPVVRSNQKKIQLTRHSNV